MNGIGGSESFEDISWDAVLMKNSFDAQVEYITLFNRGDSTGGTFLSKALDVVSLALGAEAEEIGAYFQFPPLFTRRGRKPKLRSLLR
jgi:hypothetical protein